MREQLTDITMILDRSGSMGPMRQETINGVNAFIRAQREQPGEAVFTLVQFDDHYQVDYAAKPIKEAPELTERTYEPRGWTALHDAIGKTIGMVGDRLRRTPEAERPARVLVVIQTDGQENFSKEFTAARVREMVEHQKEKYSWVFQFVGANQDAVLTGGQLGITPDFSFSYSSHKAACVKDMYGTLISTANAFRAGGSAAITPADREKQEDVP